LKKRRFALSEILDEDGRLTTSNEEIAEMCGASLETVEKARQIVMR
jgi:DNA-binding Lrp family transcriptional regulator